MEIDDEWHLGRYQIRLPWFRHPHNSFAPHLCHRRLRAAPARVLLKVVCFAGGGHSGASRGAGTEPSLQEPSTSSLASALLASAHRIRENCDRYTKNQRKLEAFI